MNRSMNNNNRKIEFKMKNIKNNMWFILLSLLIITGNTHANDDVIFKDGFESGIFLIESQTPLNGSILEESSLPEIGIEYQESNTSEVKIYLDGNDITAFAEIESNSVSYLPTSMLIEGDHIVRVEIGEHSVQWQFITSTPPVFSDRQPMMIVVPDEEDIIVGSNYEDIGSGINLNSVRLLINGVDYTTQATSTAEKIEFIMHEPRTVGKYEVELSVSDNVSNTSTKKWSFLIPAGDPEVYYTSPEPENNYGEPIIISAIFSDLNSDIERKLTSIIVDNKDVTSETKITYTSERKGLVSYEPTVQLSEGLHSAILFITNKSGGTSQEVLEFYIRKPGIYLADILYPENEQIVTDREITVQVLPGSNRSRVKEVEINGQLAQTSSDNQNRLIFTRKIKLSKGENSISVSAIYDNGHIEQSEINVYYKKPPQVTVTSPLDWQIIGPSSSSKSGGAKNLTGKVERPFVITGNIDRPVSKVEINQQIADVAADGLSFRFNDFFLHEGTNLLTFVATDFEGISGSNNKTVYVDQTAPILTIEGHDNPVVISKNTIDVRGIINDAVEGGVNSPEPEISIFNNTNGQQVTGEVLNRNFLIKKIPLVVGGNHLTITATDVVGNLRTKEITVSRVAVGLNRIVEFTGNYQTEPINTELPEPLVITAFDKAGLPLIDLPINFDVIRGTGSISSNQGQSELSDGVNKARNIIVNTDASGTAKVWLTLGSTARLAGNVVKAYNNTISESVMFSATGLVGEADFIGVSGTAGTQYAETNSYTLETLSAIILDQERNPVKQSIVRFKIEDGDAKFTNDSAQFGQVSEDGKVLEVPSDKNGLVSVRPYIGGVAEDIFISSSVRNPSGNILVGAIYQIISLNPSDETTKFSGTVLDHTGVPLSGVRLSIGRTNFNTISDAEGYFSFSGNIPLGKIDLFIDGRETHVTINGVEYEYPALHFESVIIRGQNNQLPHPIYLPPINLGQAKLVGGSEDVSLTIPGFEGFEMVISANSVTFPDGSTEGELVVSPVHNDRLPMIPPGGSASFSGVAWTIQPTGTRFDPPIQVKIPNVQGLNPGRIAPIVQWDHDLATFVPMGNGTVSENGSQIITDTGSGISKAGWGGSPTNPIAQNCAFSYHTPRPFLHILKVHKVAKRFGFLWEILINVLPHRLELYNKYEFSARISFPKCSNLDLETNHNWTFGDDTGDFFGHTPRHKYEERGEYTVYNSNKCILFNCTSAFETAFTEQMDVVVRDEDWQELEYFLEDCGYTYECFDDFTSQELWADVQDTLKRTEIEWLTDIQDWNRAKIDQLASTEGLNQVEIFILAVGHAANEVLFPISILDVNPLGKGVRAVNIAKKNDASVDELHEIALRVEQDIRGGDEYFELVKWKRLERKAVQELYIHKNGKSFYYPARGNNGFDGVVVMELPDGTMRLNIIEAKAWSANKVRANNLSAFGLTRDPNTINHNIRVLKEHIRADHIDNGGTLDTDQISKLIRDLDTLNFDVTVMGLNGSTQFADDIIDAINNRAGVNGAVSLDTTDI